MRNLLQGALEYLENHEDSLLLNVLAFPLLVLSWCYGLALNLRWVFEEFRTKVKVPCVVVSVGNMTVGGTGKTPAVAWLAEFLSEKGARVAVVSHGYGARPGGSFVLLREQEPSAGISSVAGDEAVLLSRMLGRTPVASGRKKTSVVLRTWRTLRPDVIVVDDAFQSISVRRDLDIVVIDATNPWGNGHLLPRGRLRERKENLSRGDVVILSRCNQVDGTAELLTEIQGFTSGPIVKAEHVVRGVWRTDTWTEMKLEALNDARVYAFSAVANPVSFEKTLREIGVRLVGTRRFADHHFFSAEDLEEIEGEALQAQADFVLTTEKDAMRLPRGTGRIRAGVPFLAVGIKLRMAEGAEAMERVLLRLLAGGAR